MVQGVGSFSIIHDSNADPVPYSFSKAVATLFELGVPSSQWVTPEPWIIPTVDEQKEEKKVEQLEQQATTYWLGYS